VDELAAKLQAAQSTARSMTYLGQYSFLYSQQGGTGLNANTYRDLTMYFLTLPTDRLEIWFWLESDRLLAPVFREFYKEVQVVQEERRQRIESTPTGRLDEDLRELFWADHPYAWNPMGRHEDLERLSRRDAEDFFARHYRPERMTAALVGGFDVEQVRSWAQRYFGRLPGSATGPTTIQELSASTTDVEVKLEATCPCPPQVKILYPSPRFGAADSYVLQLLSAVLNGRTGRLYRSLVADQEIAFSAYTQQISWRQAGEFTFHGESKGDADPTRLIQAWDEQVERLQTAPPTLEEIQRAVNRSTADAFRTLKEPVTLMKQLLIYQGLGDWRYINDWTEQIKRLESEDLVRVAQQYLQPDNRTIAIYRRPEDGTRP
jgi:predicted Zn-dependent peptidase